MVFKDKVVEAQLRKEERHSGLEDIGIQISANNDLVSCSQPCQNFST